MKRVVVLFVYLTWCCCSGYQITSCGIDRKVDINETGPTVLKCTGITNDTVKWDIKRNDGTNLSIATCTWQASSCKPSIKGFEASRTLSTSTLVIRLNDRDGINGIVECSGSSVGSSLSACTMRIVHKADKVSNCKVTVNNRDWTVTASCDVEKMYASDGNYSCRWVLPQRNGNKTIQGNLLKSTYMENNKEYTSGTCGISGLSMPTADGVYNYSVIIDPGVGVLAGPSLEIKQPGNPTLSKACPDQIEEGGAVDCVCEASKSSPPAVSTWYASTASYIRVLQLRNVTSMDGKNYTCTQYWGGISNVFETHIVYTLRVASVTTTPPSTMVPTTTIHITTHDAFTEDKVVGDNNNDDTKDEGLPIAIIAGGAGGGLVFIIIIIIVVVVVKKRREGSPTEQRKVDTADDDFEEHINDLYESSDARPYAGTSHLLSGHNASSARDTTEPSTVNEESETAFGYSTVGFSAPQATASAQQQNQILESDLYSSPDENGAQPPVAIATQATPKGADVYAVVNKPGTAKPHENPESQNDEYAVVDKARSEPTNGEGLETTFAAEGETEYGSGHVYSQVNKQSKQN